jgi:putative iron-regulated protein
MQIAPAIKICLILCLVTTCLTGCDLFSNAPKAVDPIQNETMKLNTDILLSSANLFAYTQMSEALSHAQALDAVLASFLHHPNPLSLEETQNAWIKTYQSYLKVSFFHLVPRFEKPSYHEHNDTYHVIQEELDSWPIEAGYIDYLPLYPLSGIVNDQTLQITEKSILLQHGFSDARYASIGFHPMEFLLFGQNQSRSAKDFVPQDNSVETIELDTSPAKPDHSINNEVARNDVNDMLKSKNASPLISEPQNHNRRREYIRLLSALNVQRLQKLTDRWEPAHGYYAKQWRQPQSLQNLQRVYQAAIDTIQTEVLVEHISMMINSPMPEDLRSPFSGQDIRNIEAIMNGIDLLFSSENSFIDAIKLRNADIADKITAQFKRLLLDINKLPNSVTKDSIESRKKRLAPIQNDTIKLLELLYGGAAELGIPLRELPVSTS